MTVYKKFSIRAPESTLEAVEEFAKSAGMSRNAAIDILLKLGIQYLHKSDAQAKRFDRIEGQLKAMQRSNYRALVYLSTATPLDPQRQEKAESIAIKNIVEIFRDIEE